MVQGNLLPSGHTTKGCPTFLFYYYFKYELCLHQPIQQLNCDTLFKSEGMVVLRHCSEQETNTNP